MKPADDVVVIGGGVIGLAVALALLEAGRSVRVVESRTAGSGSSHGNCGTLTPSHAAPLAAPGTIGRALRWMLTPDAPFYVRPRVDPALWRWFARFAARCNRRDWAEAMRHKGALLSDARAAFPGWIERFGLDCEFSESGIDYLFRTREALDHDLAEVEPLRALGIPVEVIDGGVYERGEPAVRPGLAGAIRFPGDAHLRPDRYVSELLRVVRALGGIVEEDCEALGLETDRDRMRVVTARGPRHARDVVLAAGAWSPTFARAASLSSLPIQPGKGYSITYARPPRVPARPVVLRERSVCVTAWDSGFRLGSTMEFSGYDASLNRRRLDALERGAAEYLHAPVGPARREEWFGWRPLVFDDLPIIGRMPGHRHVWAATGHGMMGMGMSTGTADMLAALVCGREPRIDPSPYRVERFA